ncbi:MAG: hypothetical protein JWO08_1276 [Verrucomicrobiaceae bacterium]|nr:hypothetical protein [Verrucomicrobiaceae bacterium]
MMASLRFSPPTHLCLLILAFIFVEGAAHAVDVVKANNANNLNLGTSWVGGVALTPAQVALWDSTVTGANSTVLGADLTWLGIRIAGPAGPVTIGGGNTLTLGPNGIDMSAATQDLTIQSGFALQPAIGQIWNVATGRTLTLNTGAFTRRAGATLNLQVTGTGSVFASGIANDATGIAGTWMTFGTGTAAKYATLSGGTVAGFTGTAAATAAAVTSTTGLVNYDVGAVGALGAGASFNTLRYTGAAGTITGNFTGNGILTAGTGALVMSGNVAIGASRELVLTNGDLNSARNLTLSGIISDGLTGPSGVTKAGLGTVVLSGANTYTGITTISRGTVSISNASALGSVDGGTRIGMSGSLSLAGGVNSAESLYMDDIVNAISGGALIVNNGINTLSGAIRVSPSTRWQASGTQLNVTGGISTTGGATGSFLVMQGGTIQNVTGKPIANGTGQLYTDSTGRTLVLGVAGSAYGSHALYGGTVQTDAVNALSPLAVISFGVGYAIGAATLNLNGNNQVAGGILSNIYNTAGGYDRIITSAAAATLNLNQPTSATFDGRFAGAVSLTKTGAGTLTLTGPSTTTGNFTLNGGTLNLNFGKATAAASGASAVSDYLSSAAPLTLGGGTFQLTGRNNGTATSLANAAWATASSTVTVTSTTGLAPGQLITGGTGLPVGAYVVSVVNATSFVISGNTTAAQTATTVTATANSFTTSQTFAGLNLNAGASAVTVTIPTSGSDGTVLNLGAITRDAGATVNFTLPTGTQSATNGITTTTGNSNGVLGAWARVGNDFATNNGTNVVANTVYTDVTRLSSGAKTITSAPASNVRIIEGTGSAANLTPAAAGTTDINTLLQGSTTAAVIYDPGTTDVLRLGAAGGIMVSSAGGALTLGTAANDGILTAGGAADTAGTLYLTNNHASNVLTINSTITNNGGGVVSVTTSGAGITVLVGGNTYTGKTVVTGGGRLSIGAQNALGLAPGSFTADQLTLAGGILRASANFSLDDANRGITITAAGGSFDVNPSMKLTVAEVIAGPGSLTKLGSGTLTLATANTFSGPTTVTSGTLELSHVSALQNSTVSSGSVSFVVAGTNTYNLGGLAGATNQALGANSISVGGNSETTTYTGIISGTGGLTKVGTGMLNLTSASTYAGDTVMSGGMLVLANANALQNSTLDTGAVGSQSVNLTMPEATTYNFGGLKGSANLDLAVSHLSVGSNNQSTTFAGALLGPFNNNLTKVGSGTLTLTGANTYGGTTTVSVGALQVGNAGAGQTGTGALSVAGGATLLGTGTVRASSATFASNANVRPGDTVLDSSHGVLTFNPIGIGTYTFQAGSKVTMGLTSATASHVDGGNIIGSAAYNSLIDGITGAGSHDQLVFNGTAGSTLAFSGNLTVVASGYTPLAGDVFKLFDWSLLVIQDFSR